MCTGGAKNEYTRMNIGRFEDYRLLEGLSLYPYYFKQSNGIKSIYNNTNIVHRPPNHQPYRTAGIRQCLPTQLLIRWYLA
jgi:hypothetical protein